MMFYLSMIIAILSVTAYQILQKQISININPVVSLMITYAVAILFTATLFILFPSENNILESLKNANYASYLLGITIVGIEMGFLLAYRNGWKLSMATPFYTSITTVLLLLIGIIFFKEYLTGIKILGIVFCILGVILLNI